MNIYEVQIPETVSDWIGPLQWILIGLALLWVALTAFSFFKRRAYNLSAVESSGGKEIKPDFLKVDPIARQEQIERGEEFTPSGEPGSGADPPPPVAKALSLTRIAGVFMAVSSFVSAVAFAFVRIEFIEAAWRKYSAWERFSVIIQEYPVGFGLAVVIILSAFVRMILTLRGNP